MAKKKRKKKRKLKIKNIIIFLLVILIFCGLIFYIITMPIKNIYITGNKILTDDIILNEASIDEYPSFLLTPSSKISNKLKKDKYINKVKVKKKIGNILKITIEEFKAIALTKNNKLILSSGEIIDNNYNISDVAILNNEVSKDIFPNFVKKFSIVNSDISRQISQIEYSPVKVDNERFLLYMDDGNIVYITLTKIKKINKYNQIKDKLAGKTGVIYLDSGDYIEIKDNKIPTKPNN